MAYGDEPGDDPEPTKHQLADHLIKSKAAQKVPCRHCGQPAGQPCINKETGHPLRKHLTHPKRIDDAKTITVLPLADEELPF